MIICAVVGLARSVIRDLDVVSCCVLVSSDVVVWVVVVVAEVDVISTGRYRQNV